MNELSLEQARALDPVCTEFRVVAQIASGFIESPTPQGCIDLRGALKRALTAVDEFDGRDLVEVDAGLAEDRCSVVILFRMRGAEWLATGFTLAALTTEDHFQAELRQPIEAFFAAGFALHRVGIQIERASPGLTVDAINQAFKEAIAVVGTLTHPEPKPQTRIA